MQAASLRWNELGESEDQVKGKYWVRLYRSLPDGFCDRPDRSMCSQYQWTLKSLIDWATSSWPFTLITSVLRNVGGYIISVNTYYLLSLYPVSEYKILYDKLLVWPDHILLQVLSAQLPLSRASAYEDYGNDHNSIVRTAVSIVWLRSSMFIPLGLLDSTSQRPPQEMNKCSIATAESFYGSSHILERGTAPIIIWHTTVSLLHARYGYLQSVSSPSSSVKRHC